MPKVIHRGRAALLAHGHWAPAGTLKILTTDTLMPVLDPDQSVVTSHQATTASAATYIGWARRGGHTLIVTIMHCTPLTEMKYAATPRATAPAASC